MAQLSRMSGDIALAGASFVVVVAASTFAMMSSWDIAFVLLSAQVLLLMLVTLQIRRRVGVVRDRLGSGVVQIRRDIEGRQSQRFGRGGQASDPSIRRILGALESERFAAERRHAELRDFLRAEMDSGGR